MRLTELATVDNLSDLRSFLRARCHELSGNLKGNLTVDLVHPYRLIFEPADETPQLKDDGGINWHLVQKVCILGVINYHG